MSVTAGKLWTGGIAASPRLKCGSVANAPRGPPRLVAGCAIVPHTQHDGPIVAGRRGSLCRNARSGRDTEDFGGFRDTLEAMGPEAVEAQARAR
jgi:hypothetical protein